jgi:hypothetical protein
MTQGWRRARWPILGLVLFACAAISILLTSYAGAIAAESMESAAIATAAAVATLWVLRSIRLALLVAALPLLAAVLSFGLLAPLAGEFPVLCDVLFPHAVAAGLLPPTGAAVIVASMYATDLCNGMEPDAAAWRAIERVRMPVLLSVLVLLLARGLLLFPAILDATRPLPASDYSSVGTLVASGFASILLLLVFPMALGPVQLSEAAIANANRRREWREQKLAALELTGEPRWAVSFCGIALVLTTIAFLGPADAVRLWKGYSACVTALFVGLGYAIWMRDWRMFLLMPAAAGLGGTLTVAWLGGWTQLEIGDVLLTWSNGAAALPVAVALAAGPVFLMAARIAGHRRFGDPVAIAIALSLKELAVPLAAFSVSLSLVLVPARLWAGPLVAAPSALVFMPALLTVLEMIFPQTRSVEELYRDR